jgi:hypothetical protein
MGWIKRNLFLIIGGVIALALLGAGGYYLYDNIQADNKATEDLAAVTQEYKDLVAKDPHPGTPKVNNYASAKREQKRLKDYIEQARHFMEPAARYSQLDSATFKNVLENTIFDLKHLATNSSMGLPANYSFTFKTQRESVQFDPKSLDPLAQQLAEIKTITEVLCEAHAHELLALRRVPVATNDSVFGSTDYLTDKKSSTNAVTGAVITPYELAFKGFSSELASVLDGFNRSPQCFVVKNVMVEKMGNASNVVDAPTYFMPGPMGNMTPQQSMAETYMRRY